MFQLCMFKIRLILSKIAVGLIIFCLLFWIQELIFGSIIGFNKIVFLHVILLKELIFILTSAIATIVIVAQFHYLPE